MSTNHSTQQTFGVFFVRTLLGLIFMMQGFGKIFTWGISGVYASAFQSYEATFLPIWLLQLTVYYTSLVEFIGGAFLLLGLFRTWTYYALASVLLIVSFGHGLSSPIWSLEDVFPRAVLLSTLLLLPKSWDNWNLDTLIAHRVK